MIYLKMISVVTLLTLLSFCSSNSYSFTMGPKLKLYESCLEGGEISGFDINPRYLDKRLNIVYTNDIKGSGSLVKVLRKNSIDGYIFSNGNLSAKRLVRQEDEFILMPSLYIRKQGPLETLFGNGGDVPYHLVTFGDKRLLVGRMVFSYPPRITCDELEFLNASDD